MDLDQIVIRFSGYALDLARFELRQDGEPVRIEPQVLSTLILLASNSDRMVSRDELIEKVWHGRIVSDAAVSARIKSARKAIGDDGKQQRLIKTVHGKGFRFVGRIERLVHQGAPDTAPPDQDTQANPAARPTVAVLPFRFLGNRIEHAFLGDAFAEEILIDLARLRWLSVIGRGSSFRFRDDDADPIQVGKALDARYCVTGSVSTADRDIRFSVELAETGSGTVVWSDTFTAEFQELEAARKEIVNSVVTNVDHHIPLHEAKAVRGRPIFSLDAWSLYYLGHDSALRFNRADNEFAIKLLRRASEQDPQFSRAYSGLSFAHHQNHFMQYRSDTDGELAVARRYAQQALDIDRNDPFAHFNMGRSRWVEGQLAESIEWLDQATLLSPSYAQGIYAKAWAQTLTNNLEKGEANAREALRLSPLDPLRYAMLGTIALSNLGKGNTELASDAGKRAARSPGAHKHIALIAAITSAANGEAAEAKAWVKRARAMDSTIDSAMFLKSFPFADGDLREQIQASLRRLEI